MKPHNNTPSTIQKVLVTFFGRALTQAWFAVGL